MEKTETFRSSPGHGLTIGIAIVAAAVEVSIVMSDGMAGLLHFGAIPLLCVTLAWMIFDRPFMRLSDGGIEISNVFRRIYVPWPSVQALESRWGFRVVTSSDTHTVWAISAAKRPTLGSLLSGDAGQAPASGYMGQPAVRWEETSLLDKSDAERRPGRPQNRAVARTLTRWDEAKDADYPGNPRLDVANPTTSWHKDVVGICGILVLLVALGLATNG